MFVGIFPVTNTLYLPYFSMSIFDTIKVKKRKRTPFDLSHTVRLTTEFGRLTPIMCEPVLPADKFKLSTVLSVQFAPMTLPVMERFRAYVHYFFVPNRLLMDDWEDFITGGESGTAEFAYPVIKLGQNIEDVSGNLRGKNFQTGSLFDYLGFPALTKTQWDALDTDLFTDRPKFFDALPFKAYQLIYNEWYRDQNLESPIEIHPEINGTQVLGAVDDDSLMNQLMTIRYRAWKKDYFTSALPDPQRGPDVTLPIAGDIRISYDDEDGVKTTYFRGDRNDAFSFQQGDAVTVNVDPSDSNIGFPRSTHEPSFNIDNSEVLRGDFTEARSATINEVRRAFAVQRLYELAARVGGRYMENILGNFGVRAGDARLQRPEYIGGSVIPITVGDVLQTSSSTSNSPLGMPAGIAAGAGQVREFTKHFTEHGWIIGILSIMPEASYIQGIPRKFLKRDRFDFAWPLLANLGEQEIQNQELYFDFVGADDDNKAGFGYTPRYAEYKFGLNSVHGDFRGSLANFHDARVFARRPSLNNEFIKVKPDSTNTGLNRIFAVTSNEYDHIWVNMFQNVKVLRKLPKYGTPQ